MNSNLQGKLLYPKELEDREKIDKVIEENERKIETEKSQIIGLEIELANMKVDYNAEVARIRANTSTKFTPKQSMFQKVKGSFLGFTRGAQTNAEQRRQNFKSNHITKEIQSPYNTEKKRINDTISDVKKRIEQLKRSNDILKSFSVPYIKENNKELYNFLKECVVDGYTISPISFETETGANFMNWQLLISPDENSRFHIKDLKTLQEQVNKRKDQERILLYNKKKADAIRRYQELGYKYQPYVQEEGRGGQFDYTITVHGQKERVVYKTYMEYEPRNSTGWTEKTEIRHIPESTVWERPDTGPVQYNLPSVPRTVSARDEEWKVWTRSLPEGAPEIIYATDFVDKLDTVEAAFAKVNKKDTTGGRRKKPNTHRSKSKRLVSRKKRRSQK